MELTNHLAELGLDCRDILVEHGIELLQDVRGFTRYTLEGLGLDAAAAATLASSLNGGGGGGSSVGGESEAEQAACDQQECASDYAKWEEQIQTGAAVQQQALPQETRPDPQPPDRYAMDGDPIARLVEQRTSYQAEGTIPRSIAACSSLRLTAGAFGECCGHPRTEHDDSPQRHRTEPKAVPAAEAEVAPLPSLALQSTDLRLLEMEALLEREIDQLRAENERLSAGGAPPGLGLATDSAAGSTAGSTAGSAAGSAADNTAGSAALSRSRATSSMLSEEATGLLAEIARSAHANGQSNQRDRDEIVMAADAAASASPPCTHACVSAQDPSRERKPLGGAPGGIDAAFAAANAATNAAADADTAAASTAAAAAAGSLRCQHDPTAAAFGVSCLRAAGFDTSAAATAFGDAKSHAGAANLAGGAAVVGGVNCLTRAAVFGTGAATAALGAKGLARAADFARRGHDGASGVGASLHCRRGRLLFGPAGCCRLVGKRRR